MVPKTIFPSAPLRKMFIPLNGYSITVKNTSFTYMFPSMFFQILLPYFLSLQFLSHCPTFACSFLHIFPILAFPTPLPQGVGIS
jgi:hypothetical protein